MDTTSTECPPAPELGERADSDAKLLAEPDGLRVLYERHFDDLFRYVAARIGRQAAEDVVAETFVVAFTRRAAFDPGYACALPWLAGIATNLLRSRRLGPVAAPSRSRSAISARARMPSAARASR